MSSCNLTCATQYIDVAPPSAYTVCRPSQWDADRATVLKLAAQEARADMDALAQTETSTIAQADPH